MEIDPPPRTEEPVAVSKQPPTETTMETETAPLNLPPTFPMCCAKESGRYSLGEPWVLRGVAYATDGCVVVRMPVPGVADSVHPHNAAYPPIDNLGWDGPWSAVDMPSDVPAEAEPEECPTCYYGQCRCQCCDEEHKCGKCGGTGKQAIKRVRVPVGDGKVGIGDGYARLLVANKASLFVYIGTKKPEGHPLRFTTPDGAEGLLMPFKADAS